MVVDFPEPVGPVTIIRPCSRAPHRVRSHSGAPSVFKAGTLVLMRRRTAPRRPMVRCMPECGHVRERQGFLAEDDDLFIDLKPRYLVLLKEDVARLLLLRGVENAVDVLRHGSRNFYHPLNTWQHVC